MDQMPSPAGRIQAVIFRRKVYVGENHKDAIDAAFTGMSDLTVRAIAHKIGDGKEDLIFGYAYPDGSSFEKSGSQEGRKVMYGFEASY
jgi:hypothetical protein